MDKQSNSARLLHSLDEKSQRRCAKQCSDLCPSISRVLSSAKREQDLFYITF